MILVTGGAGFLGRHVVRRLNGLSFDNNDILCGGTDDPNGIPGSVTNFDRLKCIIEKYGITQIVHLAALGRNLTCQDFPEKAWDVNVTGTRNVLEAARQLPQIKRVICCSSNITLSDKATVYRSTKRVVEELVELYASLGVSCTGIRPSNIYGIGQSRTEYQLCAFAALDKGFERDGYFTITGNGQQSRDWVHVEDVARCFELSLNSSVSGITVDACTSRLTSLNAIAQMLHVPVQYTVERPGDAKELVSNPEPAEKLLGFKSSIILEDRIQDAFPAVRAR